MDALKVSQTEPKEDIPTFYGKLDVDEVAEWIDAMNNYFDYGEILEFDRVKFAKSRLKGSTLVWWNYAQGERVKNGKNMITSWSTMSAIIKNKFMPIDYDAQVIKRLHNPRQKDMDVASYT